MVAGEPAVGSRQLQLLLGAYKETIADIKGGGPG